MVYLCDYYTGQETQTWLDFARDCEYIEPAICKKYNQEYEFVLGKIINMINSAEKWSI